MLSEVNYRATRLDAVKKGSERMLKKAILLLMLGGWASIASAQGLPPPWVNDDIGPVGADNHGMELLE